MSWGLITAVIAVGLAALAVLRPWRFFLARNHCPQCRQLLARWGLWGWKDDWTCPRCGCQVRR
jgi:hypothetical protein